jgi:hypothetical protein
MGRHLDHQHGAAVFSGSCRYVKRLVRLRGQDGASDDSVVCAGLPLMQQLVNRWSSVVRCSFETKDQAFRVVLSV